MGWLMLGLAIATSFALLGQALKTIGAGVAYAIWSGVGTVGIAIAAAVLFGERLTLPIMAGMALVIAGVIVMNISGSHS